MTGYRIYGQMTHTPTNRQLAKSFAIYCKSCGRPLAGSGRYHEQCDRCYRAQMRQDANESEVVK